MINEISRLLRKKRLVLCMGAHCNSLGQAERLCNKLTELLGERGPAWTARGPVRWETANCLDMCEVGPNLVVYPEGTAYHHLNIATLEQVILNALDEVNQK